MARPLIFLLSLVLLAAAAALQPAAARSDPGDVGHQGPSFAGASAPSGEKPESKLWFNDGKWWGVFWDADTADHHIYRLDLAAEQWVDTNVTVDTRKTKQDVLWDGNKLYVSSHVFTTAPASGSVSRLYRYSYAGGTYILDSGFPVTINNYKSEALVIDKDSTGTLWATWQAGGSIFVTHTLGSDLLWATPYALPVPGMPTSPDDISSLIPFGGNKLAVMWSNQATTPQQFHFAVHTDGTGDSAAAWTHEVVPFVGNADDHINLKTDSFGRVYAAVKRDTTSPDALIELLIRDAAGTWSAAIYGTSNDSHTRPIVVLDTEHTVAYMYATGPQPPSSSGQSGGDIYEKRAPLASPSFTGGVGVPVIRDASSAEMNNVTSTKQNVTSATGLVVLAGDDTTDTYWWSYDSLVPSPLDAAFTASTTSGGMPLEVEFDDQSTGGVVGPAGWTWSFGDGATSTEQHPSHTYTAAGTYTVSLTVSDASGSDTETRTGFITVLPAVAFAPEADAYVRSSSPTSKYGTATTVRTREGSATSPDSYQSYLRFKVSGVRNEILGAKLKLRVTDGSRDAGSVFRVLDNTWSESTITWATAPGISGAVLDSIGAVAVDQVVELDVTSAVTGNGTYTFGLRGVGTDTAYFSSREGVAPPQLELLLGPNPLPAAAVVADFSATPRTGGAPLVVTFADLSTGGLEGPTTWSWSFGDGATSSERNPTHPYAAAGTYTVTLTAGDGTTSDSETKTGYVVVSPTAVFAATGDAYVRSTAPTSKYGTATTLRARLGSATSPDTYRSYLRFDVTGVTAPVVSAKLRLWVTDASPDGGSVFSLPAATWNEGTITWDTAPAISGAAVGSFGATTVGTWAEVDVSSVVTGDGTYTLALTSGVTNSAYYSSREGTAPPQLVLALGVP